jgi:hypothetical protein
MISNEQKEAISIEVIKTIYQQFAKFPDDEKQNRNAPFHEAFLNAFTEKIENRVHSIHALISLSSWIQGLNTSLGQSFIENTAHILSDSEKRAFTTKMKTSLKISEKQKIIIGTIITDLSNGVKTPNSFLEETECYNNDAGTINATDFTVDVFYETDEQIVCIESKTVKPNKSIFRDEKQKILEAKTALKNLYPDKVINYHLAFPFDPLSDTSTGFDKQRFMNYSVGFRKYFSEDEFLLSSEFWDFLSGEPYTMETILDIINSIATPDFLDKYNFIQNKSNYNNGKYIEILNSWFLFKEIQIIKNNNNLKNKIPHNFNYQKYYNQKIFSSDGEYNPKRAAKLLSIIEKD